MLLVDMDGVLADFVSAACKLHGRSAEEVKSWDFYEKWGLTEDEFWEPINAAGAAFWANLEPYPWTESLLKQCRQADPQFFLCTKPSMMPACAMGKLQWIQTHLGRNFRNYFLAPVKWPLAQVGRMLIDDSDGNVRDFDGAGGDYCLLPQPWNLHSHLAHKREEVIAMDLERYIKTQEAAKIYARM